MRSGGAAAMIMGVCLVGFTCQFSPDDLADKPSHAERMARDVARSERISASGNMHPTFSDKGFRGDSHAPEAGPDEYERITQEIEAKVEAGYSPPPMGTEDEGDAQARVLANCRAGFTDERAPATGSGTMDCQELEQKETAQ